MSNSFLSHNWIQQFSLKNKVPKHTYFSIKPAMFLEFLRRIHRHSALTYDVIKSYVWDKKICNGYITLETKVVVW